jgi:uncharacterized protein (TIGR02145 family)
MIQFTGLFTSKVGVFFPSLFLSYINDFVFNKMKRQLFLTAVLCLMLQVTSFAQSIKLNNQGDPGSAMLEVNSASKGILIPNVALKGITDAITIALPAVSLLVYNTATVSDVEPGYYYNSGTAVSPFWTRLSTSTSPGTAGDGSETKVEAGTNVTITGSGTSASPYIVNASEVDGDVTNEIQDLSINGNALKITLNGSATSIDLSPYLDNTDDQTLAGILTVNTSAGDKKITNLGYPVSAQDAATKAYVDVLLEQILELQIVTGVRVKDIDDNVYKIITIGTQTWMSENLKTTKYSDGTVIPLITDGTAWETAGRNTSPGYCWYNAPNETTNLTTYGALYNWYAINTTTNGNKNVCPTGWHVPTDGEWTTLTTYLGGETVAGGKMKEAGLAHWVTPNTGATNESGFSGLPGGFRFFNGTFGYIGLIGYWWSSTEDDTTDAWYRDLDYDYGDVFRSSYGGKGSGFSVRCLRDVQP